jgi:dihydrofolate reductase
VLGNHESKKVNVPLINAEVPLSKFLVKNEGGLGRSSSGSNLRQTEFQEDQNLKGNQMRNVTYAINLTVDGCCDHTKFKPPDDDEVLEHCTHLLRDFDLLVYGRKTYQLMVPYWPDIAKSQSETKADIEFAQTFVSRKKIVFSRSLASAEVENTRIVRTNLRDEILKLKQEPGRDILVGGVDIPSQLMELGLVDEYRFVVMPVIAGEGRRLMEGVSLPEKLELKLVESKPFKSGCVALRYLKQ